MRVPGRAVEYISPFLLDFWRHTCKSLYSDQKFYHTGHVAGRAGMNPKLATHEEPLVHHVISLLRMYTHRVASEFSLLVLWRFN